MLNKSSQKTLGKFLEKQCDYYENLDAIHSVSDDRPVKISFGKLKKIAFELAGGMTKNGIKPGDPICIFGQSTIEWVLVYLAVQFIGAVDIAYESNRDFNQMKEIIKYTNAKMVFCDHEEMLEKLEKNMRIPLVHLSWSVIKNSHGNAILNLRSLQKLGNKMIGLQTRILQFQATRDSSSACSIMFKKTVGINKPLGVVHSHKSLINNLQDYGNTLIASENDRILSTMPFWHSSGRLILLLCFYKASSLYPTDEAGFLDDLLRIEPEIIYTNPVSLNHFYQRISSGTIDESHFRTLSRRLYLKSSLIWNNIIDFIFHAPKNSTQSNLPFIFSGIVLLVPLWLFLMPLKFIGKRLFHKDIIKQLGGNLNLIICGGMKLNNRIDDFFRTLGVNILESYWLTEAGFITAAMTLEMTGQVENRDRGSVGMILPSMALKLIDHMGNDVSTEVKIPAQIYIRGDNLMMGYLYKPKLTSETLDQNGWLRTGDRGILLASGNLKLLPKQSRFVSNWES